MSNAAYPRPNGWVLCRDPRLSRLLETELAYLGVLAETLPTLPSPAEGICLLVADGDDFPAEACRALAEACGCPLLLFGRGAETAPGDATCLHRPFSLTAFEKAVRLLLPAHLGNSPVVAVSEPPSETAMIPKSPAPKPSAPALPPLTAHDGVVTVGDHTVTLTPAEWSILEYLRARAGETVTRDELTALLGGSGNIADVYICRLRNKIEKPLGRRMIRTVRGAGYTFCP
jgi:hypothetical protein